MTTAMQPDWRRDYDDHEAALVAAGREEQAKVAYAARQASLRPAAPCQCHVCELERRES
jgi:hypothetical protein